MLEEARKVIRAFSFVFFTDAETEILTPFFVMASKIIGQQMPAAVSCATAIRRENQLDVLIEELPTGDLPALSLLGYPIGGAVWAISTDRLDKELASMKLYDEWMDTFMSSSTLGQLFMHSCRLKNVPVYILPLVGAVESTEGHEHKAKWSGYREGKALAAESGITPSVTSEGPAFFAVSKFGALRHHREYEFVECSSMIPPEHPLVGLQLAGLQSENNDASLADWAAALGRPELALEIASGMDIDPDRAQHLINAATESLRQRPSVNLADLLFAKPVMEFGRQILPGPSSIKRTEGNSQQIQLDASGTNETPIRACVDGRRLCVREKRIQAPTEPLSGGACKLFFFDVPLCGNLVLIARFRSMTASELSVQIKIIDQRTGESMKPAKALLRPRELQEISLPLHGIYGLVSLEFEFTDIPGLDIVVDALQIH